MADESTNPWAGGGSETAGAGGDNPWAAGAGTTGEPPSDTPPEPAGASDPWSTPGGDAEATPGDWLADSGAGLDDSALDLWHPFQEAVIPLGAWVDTGLDWLVANFRPVFQAIRLPIDATLTGIETTLLAIPDVLMVVIIALLAWQAGGRRLGISAVISLVVIGLIGAWAEAMVTLALVLTSVFFCLIIGLPMGIWLARSDRAAATIRPVLDAMQTTPAFVYLVPVVMLFGIGNVPGVVVTIIFALPPLIRLTNLGIRQVPADLVEAARSFGASKRQLLFKVQLPLAMPTIMAGVNQTLMLALSMVVIASMIAVGGLGQMVLRGIGRLDMGLATIGGVGIVLLAIILDRMTQAFGQSDREKPTRHWYEAGPTGLVRSLFVKRAA
ncbi:glycine betaine/L-proline ABC transporter permease ProW [Thiohalocapsa sp.]|jgi:glycine betaine/proline transport system permease protein|uniref:glycine betaine/L-proline ABC transporter permease ProW n=1 Tax=Thiohalocapsa sp. TaxID=2497641 RepID=UPI0025E140D1|nr:glycine betaine/L-proline ABC transporter permease ProW [Thiohalocapsa sp.]